ncbi:glycosyltransferase family 4 protein [Patescibacteria group bacterium]|nr:glycosyltransferase family 4 protein [Patescibacteria group bacterium]MBU1889903.1 glycosyltransferase family 4 protein [Patescibacteria group bacterium]
MHIGIDARFLGPEGKGLGRYTEKLIKNLETVDQMNRYSIFLRQENWDKYTPENSSFRKVLAPYRWYSLKEQTDFPRLLNKERLDLVHFPHFNIPIFYRKPFVVTIHDLIITHYPTTRATTSGPIKYFFKRHGYRLVISSAIKRAKKVITVSEYTKKELIDFFSLSPKKIEVTYEAADPFIEGADAPEVVLSKYKIDKPYLLYVGNAYPHKNLEMLLEAHKDLIKKHPGLKLVLVGRMDYFYSRLKKQSDGLGLDKDVIFPGYVPDADLPALYRQAELYVFPSLAEGFGLPPLEAMQYGIPVVSSSVSSLPEVLGQSAAYFDPTDKHAIVKVLSDLINNPEKKDLLCQRGYENIKKFSWKKMAEETLSLYQNSL